jgi:hypothetical protein
MIVLLSKIKLSYHGVLTFVSPPSFDGLRGRGLVKIQSSLLPLVEGASSPLTVCIDGKDALMGENVAEDVEDRGRVPAEADGYSGARRPAFGRGSGGTCRFSSFSSFL